MTDLRKAAATLKAHGQVELARELAELSLQIKGASSPYEDPLMLEALTALVKKLNLPAQVAKGAGIYPIPVPPHFDSLFEKVWVDVRQGKLSDGRTLEVHWRYHHADGTTNGKPVGVAYGDATQTGYRLAATGRFEPTGKGISI